MSNAPDNPLRVLIVDDEAPARSRLRDLLGDVAGRCPNVIAGMAANGVEALRLLEDAPVDLVLTDISMPVMDGVELARHLGHFTPQPAVVFVTAHDHYAVQAFELMAVDYLMKPVRAERLAAALAKVRRHGGAGDETLAALGSGARRHFSVSERGRILLVPVESVLYLKAEQKYVTARTVEREYLLDESLVQLEQEFGERFLRLHRSVLVARAAVRGVERSVEQADGDGAGHAGEGHWQVLLEGVPERLPVSRRQWPAVRQMLGIH